MDLSITHTILKEGASLSPDPFFAFLFSFLFVRDTNLAHPIKNCSLHSLVFVQPQTQTWIKEAIEEKKSKNARYM